MRYYCTILVEMTQIVCLLYVHYIALRNSHNKSGLFQRKYLYLYIRAFGGHLFIFVPVHSPTKALTFLPTSCKQSPMCTSKHSVIQELLLINLTQNLCPKQGGREGRERASDCYFVSTPFNAVSTTNSTL